MSGSYITCRYTVSENKTCRLSRVTSGSENKEYIIGISAIKEMPDMGASGYLRKRLRQCGTRFLKLTLGEGVSNYRLEIGISLIARASFNSLLN